ncbi:MAG TPA: calcium-binding protein [Sphingomicrobium sp.]|nr:calcium-binding protein [Sphingomicrobium sp.]
MADINGTPGDDAGATALVGTNGDDTINGFAGNDELFGLDGNDTLDGGSGDDFIDGGSGTDTASFASSTEGVFAGLGTSGNGSAETVSGEFDILRGIENLTGSAFNDQFNGNDADNVLIGGDGHDLLFGRGGNDTMIGGNGDDFLRGSDGADYMDGGAGWDRVSSFVVAPTSGITFDLNHQDGTAQDTGQGMDILLGIEHASGTVLNDTLLGNGGDNWLWDGADGDPAVAASGDDVISAGGGNDLVEVGNGNDTLDGGTGTDTWSLLGGQTEITSAGVTVSLALQGAAQNTEQGMMTATGFENLSGSLYDDNLTGDGNDNVIAGDLGSDILIGGAGNDTLYGDGRITVDNHGTGGSGPITTFAQIDDVDRDGDSTPDFVSGNDILDGGAGDDILDGGAGTDTASFASATEGVFAVLNNTGNGFAETLSGEFDQLFSIENLSGSAFNDSLRGNNGDNVLTGGDGHDLLFGLGGNDTMIGGNGDDFLRGSDGADVLNGGSGWDRVSSFVAVPTTGINFDLNIQGVAQDTGQGMDTLIDIEHASGTVLNDMLTGNSGDNWLWDGSDAVAGGGTGDDVLSGGGGNDLIETGGGNDTLSGGTGIDTLSFFGGNVEISSAGVTYSLALQGAVAQDTEQGMMVTSGFENVSGSIHDDVITGDSGANMLLGDLGNDVLNGGDGADTLYGDGRIQVDSHGTGGSGPITTFGDASLLDPLAVGGNDTLIGGKGNDTLYGGRGDDTLTGNQNNDRFVIEADSGDDRITDFGGSDKIVFQGVSGVDDFGDLTLTKVGNDTLITWGTSDSLTVEGVKPNSLHAGDFEFLASASSASSQLFAKEIDLGSLHDHSSVADALALGSSFGGHGAFGGDAFDHGMATLAMQAHV